jgi:hypothetical protein
MPSSDGKWTFESTNEGTAVSWSMTLYLSFPFTLMGPMLEGAMGADLEAGLDNLKLRTSTP